MSEKEENIINEETGELAVEDAADEKASSPMVCTWSPMVIEVISYALKKAPLPIVVTLSGIVTDLIMLTQKA